MGEIVHRWGYCDLCEVDIVYCGKCGNNCCNGGYGVVDGETCDACPSAYQQQSTGKNVEPLTPEAEARFA